MQTSKGNPKLTRLVIVIAGATTLGLIYMVSQRLEEARDRYPSPEQSILISTTQPHVATKEMIRATGAMAEQKAPSFRATGTDGNTYSLQDLARDRPLVLIFIKDGCPCSEAAAPYYNRLYSAYGAKIAFFGIIDRDVESARRWATRNKVSFPLLSDPDQTIVHQYKAENSAYFAIVARDGILLKYWPGYSVSMLTDASERLARLAGVDAKTIDTADAPIELYTGCPY